MSEEAASGPQPTAKDAQFFLTILTNMKNKPDVDWDVVAQKAGYNSANTAKVRFGQIKRKLGVAEADYTSPSKTQGLSGPKTPAKPRAKKSDTTPTPGSRTNKNAMKVEKTKRSRKPKEQATPKGEDHDEGQDDDIEVVKPEVKGESEEDDIEYYETGGGYDE